MYANIIESIKEVLTPDLLNPQWRKINSIYDNPLIGHCYCAAEAAYHLLGGRQNSLSVYVLLHRTWPQGLAKGETHWFLKDQDGNIIDPTAEQFDIPIEYDKATKTGFLTGEKPSLRTKIILERIKNATLL
jgi:hypothetical protein